MTPPTIHQLRRAMPMQVQRYNALPAYLRGQAKGRQVYQCIKELNEQILNQA